MRPPMLGRRVIFAAALIAGFLYGLPPSMHMESSARSSATSTAFPLPLTGEVSVPAKAGKAMEGASSRR
jgi:hypothetical protein